MDLNLKPEPRAGRIYALTNPAMPGLVKIGRTINTAAERAEDLYTTGVPAPFDVEMEIEVDDFVMAERHIHDRLAEHRMHSREFFKIDLGVAIKILTEVRSAFQSAEHVRGEVQRHRAALQLSAPAERIAA